MRPTTWSFTRRLPHWISRLAAGKSGIHRCPPSTRQRSSAATSPGQTWRWLTELRTSSPSLELVRADGREPLDVGLQETIEGRRGVRTRKTTRDGHEIFRYWNRASLGRAGKGYAGFLEVMREGSEQF